MYHLKPGILQDDHHLPKLPAATRELVCNKNKKQSAGRAQQVEIFCYESGSLEERNYDNRSVLMKVPSAEGCGEAASTVALVGAAEWWGFKAFQGLDGQWKRWSFASASRETDGVADVVSSSDDSLVLAVVGGCEGEDVAVAWGLTECSVKRFGVLWSWEALCRPLPLPYRKCLRGDQPGGRRLANFWRKSKGFIRRWTR